jgi:hypothetical protein
MELAGENKFARTLFFDRGAPVGTPTDPRESAAHYVSRKELKSMDIREFAEQYRVRLNDRKHERRFKITTSEDTVHGRCGEIVADPTYGDVLAAKFIAVPRSANMDIKLRNRYRAALAGGLRLKRKYGDAESTFHFDPANEQEVSLALKLVGAKKRRNRTLTDDQRRLIGERLQAGRREPSRMPALQEKHCTGGRFEGYLASDGSLGVPGQQSHENSPLEPR